MMLLSTRVSTGVEALTLAKLRKDDNERCVRHITACAAVPRLLSAAELAPRLLNLRLTVPEHADKRMLHFFIVQG